MGRSRTPTYILKIVLESGNYCTPMEWRVAKSYMGYGYGRPTVENIAKLVDDFEKSLLHGGANQHLGYDKVLSATITNQKTGEVIAEWSRTDSLEFCTQCRSHYHPDDTKHKETHDGTAHH